MGNVTVNIILPIAGVSMSVLMISELQDKIKIDSRGPMLYSGWCKEILIILRSELPN